MVCVEDALAHYQALKDNKTQDKHMDKFHDIFSSLLPKKYSLLKNVAIPETPYRSKKWDYSIWKGQELVGVLELKSLHKSANKNINNRQEEAVGSAAMLKRNYPKVKTSYFLIGDNLDASTQRKWELFLRDSLEKGWYDSVCVLMLSGGNKKNKTGQMSLFDSLGSRTSKRKKNSFKSFKDMSIKDLFSIYE